MPGKSKTRLSPPLAPEECAAISSCFIRDLARTIRELADDGDVAAAAVYTPFGTEPVLRRMLPDGFHFTLQGDGDLGARLLKGTADLIQAGFGGAVLVNSDSPTLPKAVLREAVDAVRQGSESGSDNVVLSPAVDGGYTLIGLSTPHERLFDAMPWSTPQVYDLTVARAAEMGLPVVNVPGWYDVDDATSYAMLEDEVLRGVTPSFVAPGLKGAAAPATTRFVRERAGALEQA
jgi:rSAM/selenodomain-associated transferase 1